MPWAPPGLHGLQQKQRQPGQLLDYRTSASSSWEQECQHQEKERRKHIGSEGPGHAEGRSAARRMSSNTRLG